MCLIFAVVFCLEAHARIEILNVIGASNFELPEEENPNLTIYGGSAGPTCTTTDNVNPCDNCAQVTGLKQCNTRRIYPSLRLRIEFRSDSTAGIPKLANEEGTVIPAATVTTSIPVNSVATVETVWQDYCSAIGDTSNCEAQADGTVRIGIDSDNNGTLDDQATVYIKIHDPSNDTSGAGGTEYDTNNGCAATTPNNQGICDYVAFPGDSKAFITSPEPASGFPLTGNIRFDRLRIYVSETDFICSPSEATIVQDLTISGTTSTTATTGDFELTNRVIDGLTNGVRYHFRIATVDKALNVNNFMADSVLNAGCPGLNYSCSGGRDLSGIAAGTTAANCRYVARPDEVLGLLTEEFNCFIASAAYGSPLDHRLDVLRNFRSEILNKFEVGRKFINFYYTEGPYAAKWVVDHPWSRPIIQFLLWPVWMFAWISLNWGLSIAASISVFSFAFPFLVYLFVRRKDFPPQQEKVLE